MNKKLLFIRYLIFALGSEKIPETSASKDNHHLRCDNLI